MTAELLVTYAIGTRVAYIDGGILQESILSAKRDAES